MSNRFAVILQGNFILSCTIFLYPTIVQNVLWNSLFYPPLVLWNHKTEKCHFGFHQLVLHPWHENMEISSNITYSHIKFNIDVIVQSALQPKKTASFNFVPHSPLQRNVPSQQIQNHPIVHFNGMSWVKFRMSLIVRLYGMFWVNKLWIIPTFCFYCDVWVYKFILRVCTFILRFYGINSTRNYIGRIRMGCSFGKYFPYVRVCIQVAVVMNEQYTSRTASLT